MYEVIVQNGAHLCILPGLLLGIDSLLVGKSGLARYGARPDEAVAEDGPLEKLLVVPEDLLCRLAVKNLIVGPERVVYKITVQIIDNFNSSFIKVHNINYP